MSPVSGITPVYIHGVGMTDFGELWDRDLLSLGKESALAALEQAEIVPSDIEVLIVANMNGESFSGQAHLGSLFVQELGLDCPSYRVEAACASGGEALQLAWQLLRSGTYSSALVLGVEKMTDVPSEVALQGLMGASKESQEGMAGATFSSLYAMIAREYFRKYGGSKEDLAAIAVKNHAYAVDNPHAQFRQAITKEQVLEAGEIASPLGLFDCSPLSDGSAAVVLSTKAKPGAPQVVSSAIAHDTIDLSSRTDITSFQSTVKAAAQALDAAGVNITDIAIAELHDCFTIAELIAYEDLGFAKKGEGAVFAANPTIPLNTSGGLKACGHPVAATGVKQIVEIVQKMHADRAGTYGYGLAHNVGGSGGTAVVTIIKNADTAEEANA